MPQIFRMGEYWIYFWTNENKPIEPVHVHIAKGKPTENATKVWITSTGKCYLCNNNSNINILHRHPVWIAPKGNKYHSAKYCCGIKNPLEMDLNDAKNVVNKKPPQCYQHQDGFK